LDKRHERFVGQTLEVKIDIDFSSSFRAKYEFIEPSDEKGFAIRRLEGNAFGIADWQGQIDRAKGDLRERSSCLAEESVESRRGKAYPELAGVLLENVPGDDGMRFHDVSRRSLEASLTPSLTSLDSPKSDNFGARIGHWCETRFSRNRDNVQYRIARDWKRLLSNTIHHAHGLLLGTSAIEGHRRP